MENSKKYKKQNQKYTFSVKVSNGSAFSVGVLEEFVVLLIISLICKITDNNGLYLDSVLLILIISLFT